MSTPELPTLRHVTERKLNKLAAHREKYEAEKRAILDKVASAGDTRAKVQALLDGFEQYGVTARQPDLSLRNLVHFNLQARSDPSVCGSLLREWQIKLERELNIGSAKYEYASLFGSLIMEWIKYPSPGIVSKHLESPSSDTDSLDFDQLGRKEMHEQQAQWEAHVFTKKKVDQARIEAYLNDIFGNVRQGKKVKKSPLEDLREAMRHVMDFKSELHTPKHPVSRSDDLTTPERRFTPEILKSCIRGVLQADLLAGQKREALVGLETQSAVLDELVDVLNMDLEGLDTWEWDPSPVPLQMRRQLNGKYRVFMDEETHQAILLHFIGKVWAVEMKKAFVKFYHSGAWLQTPFRSMDKKARRRREYFIPAGIADSTLTVRDERRTMYQEDYFMTQLPGKMFDDYIDYAAEDQDSPSSGTSGTRRGGARSPLATKQGMLRLLTTEMLLNTKVYGEFTVLQSDFRWFGPSLSHDAIFAVLKFLGVPDKWLRFFKKFLEPSLVFSHDGADAEGRVRKCGVPMSHVLADALSEALLFCLDFAVNKRTGGANIYRFHDDLWCWGQESTCVQAWEAIKEFAEIMGLEMNEEKTGAALIVANENTSRAISAKLPQGKIKWGFLVLDPSVGRWVINQTDVDAHIVELRRQLGACRSVMAWVQAWNSYVSRFFSTNFGQPANCLGRAHNDMIIEAFQRIQRGLFADSGVANATEYLRRMLMERFGTDDSVPDGFFYFPSNLGGLGLRNPFIALFATRPGTPRDPVERIERAFEEEQEVYERLKEKWDTGKDRPKRLGDDAAGSNNADDPFLSWQEYSAYREETSPYLYQAYRYLMECPPEHHVDVVGSAQFNRKMEDTPYWRWIYALYAGEVKERFGGEGLQLGERDLLPVGLVEVLRSEKVRWEG
ncbi:uncharacterized protein EI97DRAFT_430655 [Westerdykella ornata]|uniref:Uncharacterized protein n=1 Tax=Westerdykella ornata TaxID=318751 RepID=A0A6A6JU36_WESOR|nr:uncharacterized protein EI97DRAFT_430655 [Westerdykella ornata]KAF2279623.1 hypothetical protein EI97DRAFT_430655 [Westerdykella ornata]